MIAELQHALINYISDKIGKQIFSFVPPNAVFPYIHIAKVNYKDWSSKTWQGFEVTFELNIYDKNTNNHKILELSEQLNKYLALFSITIPALSLNRISIKNSEISFNKAHNLYQGQIELQLFIIKE